MMSLQVGHLYETSKLKFWFVGLCLQEYCFSFHYQLTVTIDYLITLNIFTEKYILKVLKVILWILFIIVIV